MTEPAEMRSDRALPKPRTPVLDYSAYLFLALAGICILMLGYHMLKLERPPQFFSTVTSKIFEGRSSDLELGVIDYYFSIFIVPVILLVAAAISASLGYLLLRSSRAAAREVIPDADRDLLRDLILSDKERGIDQYVRLSSLTGATGVFTKVGLTGLPLATIALTIFFTLLGLLNKENQFIDLAKLTLGAFIGSYVQKQSSQPVDPVQARSKTP